jgi:hypothetical protein
MNRDALFLADKLRQLRDPHVAPLAALAESWREEGRAVPWMDPDSRGVHSRILFLRESPWPASSARYGSGVISPDNDDQTAARFRRLSQAAGLDRRSYINWNAVPWHVLHQQDRQRDTPADRRAALPYLHSFVSHLTDLQVVVVMASPGSAAGCSICASLTARWCGSSSPPIPRGRNISPVVDHHFRSLWL